MARIFNFTETTFATDEDDTPYVFDCSSILVDEDKIAAYSETNEHAYQYVKDLLDGAIAGNTSLTTSRKYSFGDVSLVPRAFPWRIRPKSSRSY
jgi:uncharacterized pyridoxamine 5'-phosphate oxidase family protein